MKSFFAATILFGLSALCSAGSAPQDRIDFRPCADLRGSRGPVKQLMFDPTGKLLISMSTEGKIRIWDIDSKRTIRKVYPRARTVVDHFARPPQQRRIESIAISPSGKMIAEAAVEGTAETKLRLWNPEDGELIRLIAENIDNLRAVAFTPNGELLAVNALDKMKSGHKIELRNPETGKVVAELRDKGVAASLLAFSPNGKILASAGGRQIHLWDVDEKKLLHTISLAHKKSITGICFSPDSKWLASASTDDNLRIWKVETGKLGRAFGAEQNGVYDVAWSPDGKTLASAGANKTIDLRRPTTGKIYARLWGHIDDVLCLAFSPDGKLLASGSRDSTIALWDVEKIDEQKADDEDDEEDDEDDWFGY